MPADATVTPGVGETASDKTLSVTRGASLDGWSIYGGYTSQNNDIAGYSLSLSGVNGSYSAYGGYPRGTAESNIVTLENSTVSGDVYGGWSNTSGNASSNKVTVVGSTVSGGVYGGRISSGMSQNNIVTLADSTVGNVFGSSPSGATGNTLNLFNGNTVNGTVGNFYTIKLQDSYTDPTNTVTVNLKWDTEKPLLSAASFDYNLSGLDISDAGTTLKAATPGTMTLLKSGTNNDFSYLKLQYGAAGKRR